MRAGAHGVRGGEESECHDLEPENLQGLGYQQISARTGIPLGSVKSCLHRARNRLRAELGAYDLRASSAYPE